MFVFAGQGTSATRSAVGNLLDVEGRLEVRAGAMKVLETIGTEDPEECVLVFDDPGCRGETTGSTKDACSLVLFKANGEEPGEQTLEEIEDVGDGRTYFADRLERVAVEDHLPLHASVRGEEGAGVNGKLKLQRRARRKARRRAPDRGVLKREQHARVTGTDVSPLVLANQLVFQAFQPRMGPSIGSAQCFRRAERNTGALGPFIHVPYIRREDDLGVLWWGHCWDGFRIRR